MSATRTQKERNQEEVPSPLSKYNSQLNPIQFSVFGPFRPSSWLLLCVTFMKIKGALRYHHPTLDITTWGRHTFDSRTDP